MDNLKILKFENEKMGMLLLVDASEHEHIS